MNVILPARAVAHQKIVNVRDFGAKGIGTGDDTTAFNSAIKNVADAGGGTIVVPYGQYPIDMLTRINMKSFCHLKIHPMARLLGMPNGEPRYQMVNLREVTDYVISGGIFVGDRNQHDYTESGTHEWGHCFGVYGSERGSIIGCTAIEFTGDGLSVGRNSDTGRRCNDIVIAHSRFAYNRRQGISVVTGDDILIYDNDCEWIGDDRAGEATGTEPMCGIDIEPEKDAGSIKNIRVLGNRLRYNKRYGLLLERRSDDNGGADIFDVIVMGNEIAYNFSNGSEIKSATRTIYTGNSVHDNSATGTVLNGDIQTQLAGNSYGQNYYRNGIKYQNPPFALTGTSSKTDKDILKKNNTSAVVGNNYFY